MVRLRLFVLGAALVTAIACGSSATSPSNLDSVAVTVTGTGVTTYTYTANIAPILNTDCLSCHSAAKKDGGVNLSSYSGVMAVVTAGSANSLLVKATQPNGPMYVNLSGNRTTKAQTIYDWVVNSKAAQ